MKVIPVSAPEQLSNEEIKDLFLQLLEEILCAKREINLEILQKCLAIILWKIESSGSAAGMEPPDDEFIKFLQFNSDMNLNFRKTRKVHDYSSKLGVTTRKLSAICLRFGGRTAKMMINERIISEAKQKLNTIKLPLKLIAEQMGFYDQYQFSSFFKKHTNISPSLFRQNITTINPCATPSKKSELLKS
jgi:AraC family transcriptional activator of pobA